MDKLNDDLKLDIISRLSYSIKDIGRLLCVSKGWLNLVKATSYLPVKFYGVVIREENSKADSLSEAVFFNFPGRGKAKVKLHIPIAFDTRVKWLDYCNGLFLFWHPEGKSLPKYYVVFNPLTKQGVAVDKPLPKSRDRDYAVIAYDACRSNYFKIVRFESLTHMKVFYSENGRWVTLLYQLPDLVAKADWVKQCTYFEGALYRLSASGHLLRFELNLESKSEVARAMAIKLPVGDIERSNNVVECVGILSSQLCFSMSDSLKLRIWELRPDEANPIEGTYQWSLKYVISCSNSTVNLFKYSNIEKRVVVFHPYLNVVYAAEGYDLDRQSGFPCCGSSFCLSDHTSSEMRMISERGNRGRNRLHFHPVILCLAQFASTKMDNSEGCLRKFQFSSSE